MTPASSVRHPASAPSAGLPCTSASSSARLTGAIAPGSPIKERDHAERLGISRTPLPQALEYLVRDVARRHGELRAGSAGSYLRSDDETHLDQLLARRDLSHLQLRRIAPTVLISTTPLDVLLPRLRELGTQA